MRILRSILLLAAFGTTIAPAWATEQSTSEGSAYDVGATTSKGDKNAQDTANLRGGLPAVEARVAALESALDAALARVDQLQADLDAEVAARQAADANLQAQIDVLGSVDIGSLESRIGSVEEVLTCVTYDVITRDLIFVGCNVHVRDGSGLTQSTSGLGNLIVGYNADPAGLLDRFGSHNLILGDQQAYTGFGQLLTYYVGSSQDMSVVVGGNLSESVSSNRTTNIGGNSVLNVGLDRNTTIGGNVVEAVSADRTTSIGGTQSSTVDQDVFVAIGGNLARSVAQDMSVEAGGKVSLVGADEIGLTSGSAFMDMKKNGDVSIDAGGKVSIKAAGTITLKGSKIVQN